MIGVAPLALLTGASLALAARRGLLVLLMLMAASLASDIKVDGAPGSGGAIQREFTALALGAALVAWHRFRLRLRQSALAAEARARIEPHVQPDRRRAHDGDY
jgi:hypothetical protein